MNLKIMLFVTLMKPFVPDNFTKYKTYSGDQHLDVLKYKINNSSVSDVSRGYRKVRPS